MQLMKIKIILYVLLITTAAFVVSFTLKIRKNIKEETNKKVLDKKVKVKNEILSKPDRNFLSENGSNDPKKLNQIQKNQQNNLKENESRNNDFSEMNKTQENNLNFNVNDNIKPNTSSQDGGIRSINVDETNNISIIEDLIENNENAAKSINIANLSNANFNSLDQDSKTCDSLQSTDSDNKTELNSNEILSDDKKILSKLSEEMSQTDSDPKRSKNLQNTRLDLGSKLNTNKNQPTFRNKLDLKEKEDYKTKDSLSYEKNLVSNGKGLTDDTFNGNNGISVSTIPNQQIITLPPDSGKIYQQVNESNLISPKKLKNIKLLGLRTITTEKNDEVSMKVNNDANKKITTDAKNLEANEKNLHEIGSKRKPTEDYLESDSNNESVSNEEKPKIDVEFIHELNNSDFDSTIEEKDKNSKKSNIFSYFYNFFNYSNTSKSVPDIASETESSTNDSDIIDSIENDSNIQKKDGIVQENDEKCEENENFVNDKVENISNVTKIIKSANTIAGNIHYLFVPFKFGYNMIGSTYNYFKYSNKDSNTKIEDNNSTDDNRTFLDQYQLKINTDDNSSSEYLNCEDTEIYEATKLDVDSIKEDLIVNNANQNSYFINFSTIKSMLSYPFKIIIELRNKKIENEVIYQPENEIIDTIEPKPQDSLIVDQSLLKQGTKTKNFEEIDQLTANPIKNSVVISNPNNISKKINQELNTFNDNKINKNTKSNDQIKSVKKKLFHPTNYNEKLEVAEGMTINSPNYLKKFFEAEIENNELLIHKIYKNSFNYNTPSSELVKKNLSDTLSKILDQDIKKTVTKIMTDSRFKENSNNKDRKSKEIKKIIDSNYNENKYGRIEDPIELEKTNDKSFNKKDDSSANENGLEIKNKCTAIMIRSDDNPILRSLLSSYVSYKSIASNSCDNLVQGKIEQENTEFIENKDLNSSKISLQKIYEAKNEVLIKKIEEIAQKTGTGSLQAKINISEEKTIYFNAENLLDISLKNPDTQNAIMTEIDNKDCDKFNKPDIQDEELVSILENTSSNDSKIFDRLKNAFNDFSLNLETDAIENNDLETLPIDDKQDDIESNNSIESFFEILPKTKNYQSEDDITIPLEAGFDLENEHVTQENCKDIQEEYNNFTKPETIVQTVVKNNENLTEILESVMITNDDDLYQPRINLIDSKNELITDLDQDMTEEFNEDTIEPIIEENLDSNKDNFHEFIDEDAKIEDVKTLGESSKEMKVNECIPLNKSMTNSDIKLMIKDEDQDKITFAMEKEIEDTEISVESTNISLANQNVLEIPLADSCNNELILKNIEENSTDNSDLEKQRIICDDNVGIDQELAEDKSGIATVAKDQEVVSNNNFIDESKKVIEEIDDITLKSQDAIIDENKSNIDDIDKSICIEKLPLDVDNQLDQKTGLNLQNLNVNDNIDFIEPASKLIENGIEDQETDNIADTKDNNLENNFNDTKIKEQKIVFSNFKEKPKGTIKINLDELTIDQFGSQIETFFLRNNKKNKNLKISDAEIKAQELETKKEEHNGKKFLFNTYENQKSINADSKTPMEIESFSKKEDEIKFHAAYDQQENDSEKIEQKIASEDEISSLKTNEQVKFQESYKEKQIENHDTDPSNFKGTEESIEKIDFQEHENKPEILDNDRKALESTPFNGNQYKNFNLYPNLGSISQETLSVGVNFNYKNKLLSYDQSKICTNKKPIGSSELDDFNISSVSETEKEDYTEKSDFLENVSGTIIINEKNLLPKKILEDLDFKKTNIELNAKIDQDDIQDEKSENDKDENDQPLLEKKPGETYSSNLLDKKTDIAEQEQNTKVYLPALNSSNERKLSKKNSNTNKSDYNKKNSSAIVIANDEFVFYKDPIKHMINVDLLKSSEVEETKKSADTKIIDQSDEKPEKNNKMIKALKNVKIHGKGFFSNFSNVFNSKKNNSDKLSETKKTEPNVKNDAKIEILVNNEKTHEDEVIEVEIDEIAISKTKDDEFNTNKDISDNDLPEKLHETKTLNPDTENINSGSEKLEITAIEAPVSVSDENEYFLRELLSHNQKRLSERLSKGSIKSDQNNNNSIKNSKGKNLDLENVSLEENQPKDLTEKTKAVPISNDSNLNDDYFSAEVDNSFEKFENENKKNNQNEKPEDAISLETKGENFNGGFDNFNNNIFVQNNENNSSQDLESNFSIEIKNIAKKISKNYVEQDEKDLTIDKSNILKLEIDNEESSLLVNNDAIENKQETNQKSYPENFINPIINTDENAIETKSISDIEKQIDLVFNNALSSHNEESKFSEESDYPGLIKPESFPITSNDSEELTVEPFNLAEKEQIKTTEFTGNKKNSQDLDIENDKSMIYTTVEPQNITSNSNKKR